MRRPWGGLRLQLVSNRDRPSSAWLIPRFFTLFLLLDFFFFL